MGKRNGITPFKSFELDRYRSRKSPTVRKGKRGGTSPMRRRHRGEYRRGGDVALSRIRESDGVWGIGVGAFLHFIPQKLNH